MNASRSFCGLFAIFGAALVAGLVFPPSGQLLAQSLPVPAPLTPSAAAAASPQATIDRYCIRCHNARTKSGGLVLEGLNPDTAGVHADTWEKVVIRLRTGSMPPAGSPRPDAATYDRTAAALESTLDRAAAASPQPGRARAHRLNRAEYTNAIRDLLGLEIDGRALLPADDSGYGFDNIADVLSLTPALLDRYMTAADRISRLAVGDASLRPVIQTYSVRPTTLQHERGSELQPFGTRGGLTVRHYFPLDGDYVFKVRLQRTHTNSIRGLSEPNDIEFRLDRARVKSFRIGGEGPLDPWSAVPSASAYEQTADDGMELRVKVRAGTHTIGVDFPNRSRLPEGVLEPRLSVATYEYAGDRDLPMAVESVQISGPYEGSTPAQTTSRARIFQCQPHQDDETSCARTILSHLARRAFRRPVTAADIDPLLAVYRTARQGHSFDHGIELALRTLLVDPDFLFRIERDPVGATPGTLYRISDLELASRLSFFLWSSIPDEPLLALAERGALHEPAVLAGEVRRLLSDPRAEAFVTNFAGQWLYLRNMRSVAPDPENFPDFDDNLREAFARETELFVRDQVRDDRSLLDLITANYTFVNDRLARHYGIPNVYGSSFRKVTLPDDRRGGLLTHGSILTATSYANRTAPTIRGKWILQNLLGTPPPPPPPNVPALAEAGEGASGQLSVRERLEQHRRNAVCASCHAPMDPMGLALENFDAIGQWRTTDNGTAIDARAVLPDGTALDGPGGVRALLLTRQDRFVQTVTDKLLTYALGRGTDYHDAPTLRAIARGAAAERYRWSSIILGIVQSTPFQMRRSGTS